MLVSSANRRKLAVVQFCISFTKTRKNNGPKTEPWGTPHVSFLMSDLVLSILVYCDRSLRYDFIKFNAGPLIPYAWSLASNML